MDNEQGNIAIQDTSNDFRGGPVIMIKISKNETIVKASRYFEQQISVTLDKKITIKRRPILEDN